MYIINNKRQLERIKTMVPVRKNMNTFEVYYHDPTTGELWKSFFPRGYQGHQGPKLLRPEPMPENLELQLEICLNSKDDSDAIGLGIECSVKPGQWLSIITLIDKNRNKYLRSNLNVFLNHLGVLDPKKSLTEINLKPEEYGLDDEALQEIKKKAKRVKLKRFFRV
ncbi:MAG: hypothetical protein WD016_01755 [Balneolaceae bacterium]